MVKAAWFRSYAANERPDKFDHVVQSWDTANKASELSDFSVCTTWGIKGKEHYLLHVLRRRMEYPELRRAVRELTVFPKSKHDDQVDSTAQMLDWFKRGGQEQQEWIQALARGPQPASPEPLSVMAKRLGILRPLF